MFAQLVELVDVLTDHEDLLSRELPYQRLGHLPLRRGRRAVAVLLGLGGGVREPLGVGEVDADLDTVGGRDVPLRLDLLPGRVEPLGPISEKTSDSRPSSRTRVAVRPSRRRAWRSAVNLKTGAGSRCTSS